MHVLKASCNFRQYDQFNSVFTLLLFNVIVFSANYIIIAISSVCSVHQYYYLFSLNFLPLFWFYTNFQWLVHVQVVVILQLMSPEKYFKFLECFLCFHLIVIVITCPLLKFYCVITLSWVISTIPGVYSFHLCRFY